MIAKKRFCKNLSFVFWARLVSVSVSLIFLGISARAFGVIEFGHLVFVLATTSFLELTFCGSTDTILVREQVRSPQSREENLRTCASLHAVYALTVVFATGCLALHFRRDWNVAGGLLFAGMGSACQILFCIPVADFRSQQNMSFESVLITMERLLFLCGFLLVIAFRGRMVLVFACYMGSMAAKTVVGYVWLLRRVKIRAILPQRDTLRYFCRESLPLMGITLLLSLHWRLDLFFMKLLSSAHELGIYAASFRAMEMLRMVPVDVITTAFPIFCKAAANQSAANEVGRAYGVFVRLTLCVAVPVTAAGVLFASVATHLLFGTSFHDSAGPLRLLVLAFPLIFWNQIDSITLTATGRQRFMFYSLLACLACQVVADLILIPSRGASGAGVGFGLGELALLAGTLFAVAPLSRNVVALLSTAAKLVFAAILVGFLAWGIEQYSPVLAVLLLIPAYLFSLLLLGVVTREEICQLRARVSGLVWARARVGDLRP